MREVHGSETPLGLRWWVSQTVALDAGVGFDHDSILGQSLTRVTGEFGIPFQMAEWERVGFYLRPGVSYTAREQLDSGPPFYDKVTDHSLTASLRAEAEVFVVSRVSLSGSFGIQYTHLDRAGGPDTNEWGTTGGNFTNLGFHIYFGGPR